MAFLDISPVRPGHALIIPKQHIETMYDMPKELLGPWMGTVQLVAKAQRDVLGCAGVNLLQNNGAAAGQVIHHVHMHAIPRDEQDGLRHWPGTPLVDGALMAERLARAIQP